MCQVRASRWTKSRIRAEIHTFKAILVSLSDQCNMALSQRSSVSSNDRRP